MTIDTRYLRMGAKEFIFGIPRVIEYAVGP